MDAGIQGALAILSTISGPSPVLDGLVDQIVTTGLPMVPILVAAAQGQPSADTTARMLLNGVQRASEHVDVARKIAIVKGIATHVCPSPVLTWPIRAFAVKALQTIIQQHFASAAAAETGVEAVAAATEAMVHIIHTAQLAELSKQLKVSTPATDAINAAPHPYHSAEIKSAAELFGILAEIDADTVASVYAPKQKLNVATASELVATATEQNSSSAATAAAVSQAITNRYDPIALGGTRTAPLRGALEKLNCGVLTDMGKELAAIAPVEAFDRLISAYPHFFGRNQHLYNNQQPRQAAQQPVVAATEGGDEGAVAAAEPAAVAASPAASFVTTVKSLLSEHSLSKDTVCMFLKSQLKEAITRVASEMGTFEGGSDNLLGATSVAVLLGAWEGRLKVLARNDVFARTGSTYGPALIELIYGLLRVVSFHVHNGETVLGLAREIEHFTHRSLPPGVANAADMTAAHSRIADGLRLVLKSIIPYADLPTEGGDASDAAIASICSSMPIALLEVTFVMLFNVTPKPSRAPYAKKGDTADGEAAKEAAADENGKSQVAEKRSRDEGEGEDAEDEGNDAAADGADADNATTTGGAAPSATAKPSQKTTVVLHSEAQRFVGDVLQLTGGALLTTLQRAQRLVCDELATVEKAKRLKALLGEKAPTEVLTALTSGTATVDTPADTADDAHTDEAVEANPSGTPYLTIAQLQYRNRSLHNVVLALRMIRGDRATMGAASYLPQTHHHHNNSHQHRGGGRNASYNNRNDSHQQHSNTGGRGGDFKRHRNEGTGGRQNNNNNTHNNDNRRGSNNYNNDNRRGHNNNYDSRRNDHRDRNDNYRRR